MNRQTIHRRTADPVQTRLPRLLGLFARRGTCSTVRLSGQRSLPSGKDRQLRPHLGIGSIFRSVLFSASTCATTGCRHARPRPAPPPRSRPPAATAPAPRARSRDEGKARASRNALKHGLCAMHHLVLEDEVPDHSRPDRHRHRGDRCGERDRDPARPPARHRVLEGRAGRADRGRPVRRRTQDAAAADRLPVGGGRPADHLRPQALQRGPRPAGASIGREISRCLKELRAAQEGGAGAARTKPGRWPKRNYTNELWPARTNPSRLEKEPEPAAPANDDASAPVGCRGSGSPTAVAKRTRRDRVRRRTRRGTESAYRAAAAASATLPCVEADPGSGE